MCECYFCCHKVSLENAIADGWTPSFWIADDEIACPVCPDCSALKLVAADDGEIVLRDERLVTRAN